MTQAFPTAAELLVDLRVPAGRVEVEAAPVDETTVSVEPLNDPAHDRMDKVVVRLDGDRLRVEAPEQRGSWLGRTPEWAVVVRCAEGSRVRLQGASTDLTGLGRLGDVESRTASGDVRLQHVGGDVRVESASGDVRVDDAAGEVRLRTASGDLSVGHAGGALRAQSVSGDVSVDEAGGEVEVQTVSGDLHVGRIVAGPVSVNAVSGDVDLAVARGAAVWLDLRSLSGEMRSELDAGDGPGEGERVIELRGKTVSGDVRVRRAAA